jgi:hypothetical protein
MFQVKQSKEQWTANVNEAIKRLRPAEFLNDASEDGKANGQLLSKWLRDNCSDGEGWTDGSVENLLAAVAACDAARLLKWKVAPKRKPAKPKQDVQHSGPGGLRNHAQEQPKDLSFGNDPTARVAAGKELMQQRADENTLSQARRIFETFSAGKNHAHTQAARKVLKAKYDELVGKGLPADQVLHDMSSEADKQYNKGQRQSRF